MIRDARNVPAESELSTDVCIIGGGAAGIALALEFARRPFRAIVLESGGEEPDEETQKLHRGRVFGRQYFRLDDCRTRQLGGSTNCWQGLCRPLDAIDFEERDWVPQSGWPLDAAELDPFYRRAQDVLQLPAFAYDGDAWAQPGTQPLPFGGDAVRSGVFQVAPRRFGTLYRDELKRMPNVDVHLFANAVDLEASSDAARVERVRVATLSGNRFGVRARIFVLATGGIENPRLLLTSRGVQRDGLGNAHDLVGRTFMEHPHLLAGAFLPATAELDLGFYRAHERDGIQVAGWLAPTERALRQERLLNSCSFLARDVELPPFEGPLARVLSEMRGNADPAIRAVFLMNEAEQAPNPASRVRLIDERDELGMPRVQLEWRLSAQDKASLRRTHEIVARELGRAGIGRLQMMLDDEDLSWPKELGGGRHHMGTTRMHPDPKHGVVDADCRVHGLANLYVAGSSVFPTSGAANPTLTLLALALRLADRVRGELEA